MINFFEQMFVFMSGLVQRLYTLMIKWRFRAWGRGSVIGLYAKVISPSLICVGNGVVICENAWLNANNFSGDKRATLSVGDNSYIGRFVHINAWQNVEIEDNVMISDRVYISDADHYFENSRIPIKEQGVYFKGAVVLKSGCWIGVGAAILPGVTIGRNSVVGANSVVTRDVPDHAVVGGIPAKIIRMMDRSKEEI